MTFFGKFENVEELHSECEVRFSQCVQSVIANPDASGFRSQ